jgi:hypothetical protein
LLYATRLAVLAFKIFFLIITGFRKLKVKTVAVNNAFLLANGAVMIHWRVQNALWICVDRRWMGSRGNQILVLPAQAQRTVSIHIQGLFSSYKNEFDVSALAKLAVGQPRLPEWTLSVKGSALYPVLSPALRGSIGVAMGVFRPELRPMSFVIPPIPTVQTKNQYETGLLHHP